MADKNTYYAGLPRISSKNRTFDNGALNYSVLFDDGTVEGYEKNTIIQPNGNYSVREFGTRNGVDSAIHNRYLADGTIQSSDTTFNGIHNDDPRFQQLKLQFEGKKPIQQKGGYLRLQKQGGKLTEVWTPFN